MTGSDLRHTVTFERYDDATGDFNSKPRGPVIIAAGVPAAVVPQSGAERVAGDQVQATLTHTVTVRWQDALAGLTAADRIRLGSRVLQIESVMNVGERDTWIECRCSETTGHEAAGAA